MWAKLGVSVLNRLLQLQLTMLMREPEQLDHLPGSGLLAVSLHHRLPDLVEARRPETRLPSLLQRLRSRQRARLPIQDIEVMLQIRNLLLATITALVSGDAHAFSRSSFSCNDGRSSRLIAAFTPHFPVHPRRNAGMAAWTRFMRWPPTGEDRRPCAGIPWRHSTFQHLFADRFRRIMGARSQDATNPQETRILDPGVRRGARSSGKRRSLRHLGRSG